MEEKDEILPADEKRRQQVYVDEDDALAEVLGVAQGDYECVMVNSSWPEKSLLEGDIVLFDKGEYPQAGDIVLIEQEGMVRMGLMGEYGYLETPNGNRPLEATERIVGVGLALARKLGNR